MSDAAVEYLTVRSIKTDDIPGKPITVHMMMMIFKNG